MSRAAAIFYCPYCAEEDLRPLPEPASAWRCIACTRSFVVTAVRGHDPSTSADANPDRTRSITR